MPTSKKRKFQRKQAKQYSFVKFTSDLFEDEFVLPDVQHMTLGLLGDLNKGNIEKVIDWLRSAGVEEDALEAMNSLEAGEVEEFMDAWGNGSLTSLPKSSA